MQRSDDTEEKVRNRLNVYHSNVDSVIGYYQDQKVEVRGSWVAAGAGGERGGEGRRGSVSDA